MLLPRLNDDVAAPLEWPMATPLELPAPPALPTGPPAAFPEEASVDSSVELLRRVDSLWLKGKK